MLRLRALGCIGSLAVLAAAATGASAQSPVCLEGQKLLEQRGAIIQRLSSNGKKKMTPAAACSTFSGLVNNGAKVLAWIEQNGAWCSVPDQIKVKIEEDHKQAQNVRGQACNVAAKQRQMEAQAARQRMQGAPGGFGGNGGDIVSGAMRVPQGAL